MNEQEFKTYNQCPSAAISAYLDCELSAAEELELEHHLAECQACFEELNAQKTVLLAVDSAFETRAEIEPPADFARVVAVNAESQISGQWTKKEILKIIGISGLILLSSAVIFIADLNRILAFSIALFETVSVMLLTVIGFVGDFAAGLGILARSLGRQTVSHTGPLAFISFALSILLIFLVKTLSSPRKP